MGVFFKIWLKFSLLLALAAPAGVVSATKSDAEMREWAEKGNALAQFDLGRHLLDTQGERGYEEAVRWLRRAALSGNPKAGPQALQVLGEMQEDLILKSQVEHELTLDPAIPSAGAALFAVGETDAAIDLLIREAQLLNLAAERYLQVLYEGSFEEFPQYDARILAYFRAASAEGLPSAQLAMGRFLLLGLGVEADREAGERMLLDVKGPLGRMELAAFAVLVKDEPAAARHWLAAAEDYRHPPAMFNLGVRALRNRDPAVARDYFERTLKEDSAHQGAQLELARLLGLGHGGAADPKRAVAMLDALAKEGQGRVRILATANLGLFYKDGVGVARDPQRALELLREAEAAGMKSVRRYIQQLEMGL